MQHKKKAADKIQVVHDLLILKRKAIRIPAPKKKFLHVLHRLYVEFAVDLLKQAVLKNRYIIRQAARFFSSGRSQTSNLYDVQALNAPFLALALCRYNKASYSFHTDFSFSTKMSRRASFRAYVNADISSDFN